MDNTKATTTLPFLSFIDANDIYMLSTVFMAVLITFYISKFIKTSENQKENGEEIEELEDEEKLSEHQEELQQHERMHDAQETEEVEVQDVDATEEEEGSNSDEEKTLKNGVKLADGLVGKIKTARLKELEAQLTHDQLEEERRIEREQLAAIFGLLKKQEADLNMKEIDENELTAQLHLYR